MKLIGEVSTLAGDGTAGCIDGQRGSGRFNQPYDVKLNTKDSSLLIADLANKKIRKVTSTGTC